MNNTNGMNSKEVLKELIDLYGSNTTLGEALDNLYELDKMLEDDTAYTDVEYKSVLALIEELVG
jgi:hypothetical protein